MTLSPYLDILVVLLIGLLIPLSLTGWALFMKAHGKKNDEVHISRISYIDKFLVMLLSIVAIPLVGFGLGLIIGQINIEMYNITGEALYASGMASMFLAAIIGAIGAVLFMAYKHYRLFNLTKAQGALVAVLSVFQLVYFVLAYVSGGTFIFMNTLGVFTLVWAFGVVYAVYWWLTYGKKKPSDAP